MNGYERSSGHDREADALEPLFPLDFTSEEAELAGELRALFPIEDEVLPPLYVQTLMDDPWVVPVSPADERTLARSVFARLRVARPPVLSKLSVLPLRSTFVETIAQVNTFSRSLVVAAGVALATMFLTVLLTGPAFAQGLQILLGHTGVQQVQAYPSDVRLVPSGARANIGQDTQGSLAWFGPSVDGYDYDMMRLERLQSWSEGPVVHMQYVRGGAPGSAASSVIDVREFQVASNLASVLQVVKVGSARETWVGSTRAVYVDGGWAQTGKGYTWHAGTRSELIFERDGMVFWIAGNQRDGVDEETLVAVAQQLQPITLHDLQPHRLSIASMGSEFSAMLRLPSSNEIYELVPLDGQQGVEQLVSATAPGTVYG